MTTKNTLGKKHTRGLEQDLQLVGEQLRLARLWRNLSMDQIAQRASCSIPTLSKVEKGDYFIEYDEVKKIINEVKKALFGWGKIASSLKIPQNENSLFKEGMNQSSSSIKTTSSKATPIHLFLY